MLATSWYLLLKMLLTILKALFKNTYMAASDVT